MSEATFPIEKVEVNVHGNHYSGDPYEDQAFVGYETIWPVDSIDHQELTVRYIPKDDLTILIITRNGKVRGRLEVRGETSQKFNFIWSWFQEYDMLNEHTAEYWPRVRLREHCPTQET